MIGSTTWAPTTSRTGMVGRRIAVDILAALENEGVVLSRLTKILSVKAAGQALVKRPESHYRWRKLTMTEQATRTATGLSEEEIRVTVLSIIMDMAPKQDAIAGPESVLIDDLGFHSLALMEVAFALEDEFDLDPIDEDTARRIKTVGAVQDLVVEKINARNS